MSPSYPPHQGLTAEEVLHGVRMASEDVPTLAAHLPSITARLAAVRAWLG
jgi:hypothetical protein